MEKERLISRLNFAMRKVEVIQLAESFIQLQVKPDELIELALQPSRVGFRAAWVLENVLLQNMQALDYYLLEIAHRLPLVKTDSVKRHFAKILAVGLNRIVSHKAAKVFIKAFWSANHESLQEFCFNGFIDEKSKSALRVHCLEILYLLSTREKWIAEELPAIIENQLAYCAPSLRARGKDILGKLSASKK